MSGPLIILFFGLFGVLFLQSNGYTYRERLTTRNGYCEGPDYGSIKVGRYGYNDESCEKILCHEGYREVLGCGKMMPPNDPQCEVARGPGHYPDCCPAVRCT